MNIRKTGIAIAAVLLAVAAAAALLSGALRPGQSRYSRVGQENHLHLDFYPLNCAISESYTLSQGDAVEVSAACKSGALRISIGRPGEVPVYEGDSAVCDAFTVHIPDDGAYDFEVSGKNAVGSIDFQVHRTAGELSSERRE
ncbi:MAG: hypothetical protein ACI4MF_01440 [Candidatus Faecivicinus sp.]